MTEFRHYEEFKIKEVIDQNDGYKLYYIYDHEGKLFCMNIGSEKESSLRFGNYCLHVEAIHKNRIIVRQRNPNYVDILKFIVIEEDHIKINNYKVPCLNARMEDDEPVIIPGGYVSFSQFLEPYKNFSPLVRQTP